MILTDHLMESNITRAIRRDVENVSLRRHDFLMRTRADYFAIVIDVVNMKAITRMRDDAFKLLRRVEASEHPAGL